MAFSYIKKYFFIKRQFPFLSLIILIKESIYNRKEGRLNNCLEVIQIVFVQNNDWLAYSSEVENLKMLENYLSLTAT